MGLLDLFFSEEKKILRHTRRLTNRDAQPEDREASIVWLANNGSPNAIAGILSRFDMNLDHQLKDAGEKDTLYDVLAELGPDVVARPLDVWLRQCRQFALPLRLLEQISGRDVAVDMALDLLKLEYDKDYFKPEKKHHLLVWLSDIRDPRCVERGAPFLRDFDEGVRYAAVELMLKQEGPEVIAALVSVLMDEKEESKRLKVRTAEGMVQRGWSVAGLAVDVDRLPEGFAVKADRLVRT